MKRILLTGIVLLSGTFLLKAQDKDIVTVIDELTVKWDTEAKALETYEGLGKVCKEQNYRLEITDLLNSIHHYDSTLLNIVTRKYDENQDAEAKATLDDIATLEKDYATKDFMKFMHKECREYNATEMNTTGKEHKKEAKHVEKELVKYIEAITKRIDVIDDHVHHLKGL